MRPVGRQVAELGHVDQLVVDHRRAAHVTADHHAAGFGRAVGLHQLQPEKLLHPGLELWRDRSRPGHRDELPPTDQADAAFVEHLLLGDAVHRPAVDLALYLLVDHLPDPGHEGHLRRPDQRDVLQQGGQVALRGEVDDAAVGERAVDGAAAHHVAHRQEAQDYRRQRGLLMRQTGPPGVGDQPLGVHGALGGAGAAGGVDQDQQRVRIH